MNSRSERLVSWSIDTDTIDTGDAGVNAQLAAVAALAAIRNPGSTGLVFEVRNRRAGTATTVDLYGDPPGSAGPVFNGDTWFWTLTPEESEAYIADDFKTAVPELLPDAVGYAQEVADTLMEVVVVITEQGDEILVVHPAGEEGEEI